MFRRSMSRLLPAVLALSLVAGCSSSDGPATSAAEAILPAQVTAVVPTGEDLPSAPVFDTQAIDGTRIASADLWANGPVVMVFFATWCSVCVDRQSEFSSLYDRYRNVSKFLGVAGDEKVDDLQQYLVDHPVGYPVVLDTQLKLWKSYAASEPPMVALISKDGYLVRGWTRGATAEEVRVELDKLLGLGD